MSELPSQLPSIATSAGREAIALEIFALRSLELADQVASGNLPFLETVNTIYDAAVDSGLIDTVGDRIVQATHRRRLRQCAEAGMTELRPYQQDVHRRLSIASSPPASGASSSSRRLAPARRSSPPPSSRRRSTTGSSVLVLAHTREIIKQTSDKLFAHGIEHGIIQAGFTTRPGRAGAGRIVQTLWARAMREPAHGPAAGRSAHHRRMPPLPGQHLPQDHRRLSGRRPARPDGHAVPWRRPRAWRHLRRHRGMPAGRRADRAEILWSGRASLRRSTRT